MSNPTGYFPYEKAGAATSFPEPVLGPKPLPVPVDDDLTMTSMDPMSRHYPGEYVLRARMPHGYPRKISCHPATERREWKLPELIPAVRQEKMHNISQLSGALVGSKPVSGFGWKTCVNGSCGEMGFGDWWAWEGSPWSVGVKREPHTGKDGKV